MFTPIASQYQRTPEAQEAEQVLRACVHCGFCLATCPTYQVTGNELDSPRGRIYLIKNLFEGQDPGVRTQTHLDRCLTCRACESTCPSGVRYGRLVSAARSLLETRFPRSLSGRVKRYVIRKTLGHSALFSLGLKVSQMLKPALPARLQASIPQPVDPGFWPAPRHAKRMVILDGCVQPAIDPGINAALARILDRVGISLVRVSKAGCCGALPHHTGSHSEGLDAMRRNIDAWWPEMSRGDTLLIATASGCGSELKEMGEALKHDEAYRDKAHTIASAARDVAEVLAPLMDLIVTHIPEHRRPEDEHRRIVYHPPCSLQHGQKIRGVVEAILVRLGYELLPFKESHLCCGSAGSYSLLEKSMSTTLKLRKLGHLLTPHPSLIATANIGCQVHLQSGTQVPVIHWVKLMDAMMTPQS